MLWRGFFVRLLITILLHFIKQVIKNCKDYISGQSYQELQRQNQWYCRQNLMNLLNFGPCISIRKYFGQVILVGKKFN